MSHPVAEEIYRQLGPKARTMLGAKNFVADVRSLTFHVSGSRKCQGVRITLNPKDLYDIQFWKFPRRRGLSIPLPVMSQEMTDVHVENLHVAIEDGTGLYTSLAPRG